MPLGTMLTDLLHELLNKGPNPTGNQEFVFCHYPCGSATHKILRGLPQAGGEQNKPCVGRRCGNLARALVQEVTSKGSPKRGAIVDDQYAGGSICTGHRATPGVGPCQ